MTPKATPTKFNVRLWALLGGVIYGAAGAIPSSPPGAPDATLATILAHAAAGALLGAIGAALINWSRRRE